MDQLKKILAGAVKHQFWIITGVAAVLASLAWFMTNSSLNKQFADNAKNIDEKFKAMSTVSSAISTHPNDHSIAEMTKIIDGLATDVEAAWSLQYKRQEQYLQWREEAIKLPTLINKLKKLYPIELKATFPEEPKNPPISSEEKRRFSQYFAEQMPELAKIIGVTWVGEASAAGAGGMGMGPGMGGGMGGGPGGGEEGEGGYGGMGGGMGGYGGGMGGGPGGGMGGGPGGGMGGGPGGGFGASAGPQSNDVVIWSKPSQSQLLTSLKMWQGDQPTVYQIMYTQENMWILEGIFNIIARTNLVAQTGKPATANFQATIKEIEFIKIGRDAVANSGSIAGSAGGMGGGDEGGGMGAPGMAGMGPGEEGSGGGEGGEGGGMGGSFNPFRDPADNRYVDAAYKPISGDELRTKITSQNAEDAYFAVAKRIPVRLKFKIDYSQLQRFLANCGNEGLLLEVRQVRVGKFQDTAATGYGGGLGGGMGGAGMGPGMGGMGGPGGGMGGPGGEGESGDGSSGGDGSEGGYGGMGGGMGGYGGMGGGMGGYGGGMGGGPGMGGGMGGSGLVAMKKPDELTVEVYGVVYLFNPANIESLGLSKVTEDTQLKDTVSTPPAEPSVPAVDPNVGGEPNAGSTPSTPSGDNSGADASAPTTPSGSAPPDAGAAAPGAAAPGTDPGAAAGN